MLSNMSEADIELLQFEPVDDGITKSLLIMQGIPVSEHTVVQRVEDGIWLKERVPYICPPTAFTAAGFRRIHRHATWNFIYTKLKGGNADE